jgi:hypothetical protein
MTDNNQIVDYARLKLNRFPLEWQQVKILSYAGGGSAGHVF